MFFAGEVMRKSEIAAIGALVFLFHNVSQEPADPASPLIIAQTDAPAAPPAAPSAPAPSAPVTVQPPAAAATPKGNTIVAPAEKSALSIPACSVRYLEAKFTGKLNGRKWVDFRREECGRHETTAVFPTAISPKS